MDTLNLVIFSKYYSIIHVSMNFSISTQISALTASFKVNPDQSKLFTFLKEFGKTLILKLPRSEAVAEKCSVKKVSLQLY